jgi:hypothetical protein
LHFLAHFFVRDADGLTKLRAHFLGFAFAPLPIVSVVYFIAADFEPRGVAVWTAATIAVGFLEVGLVVWSQRRFTPLLREREATADPGKVADTYRRITMLGIALASASFLIGFVAAMSSESAGLIWLGLPFMATGLALCAPTAGNLARRQEELRVLGSPVDLVEAVKTTPWRWQNG